MKSCIKRARFGNNLISSHGQSNYSKQRFCDFGKSEKAWKLPHDDIPQNIKNKTTRKTIT
jgi:hypothetical protein